MLVNRATGAVTPAQTTGNVIANLNARLPSQRRCGSLNARRGDLVRFVGRLALVENPASRWATIQSCHSRRFQKLSNEAAVGAHAIVWTTNASRIVHAINAQTGHAFAITIPHQLRGQISGVAITNKKLYVSGDDSDPQVWSARVPSGLSSNG